MSLYPFLGLHDPFSSLSHLAAAGAAVAAWWALHKRGRGDRLRVSSLWIYSASLLILFAMSGVYHALPLGHWRALFRRLDYAAIWLVIAGSATPVHILLFKGHWRWGLIALFWGIALTCLVVLQIYFGRLSYPLVVLSYAGAGSLGIVSFWKITARHGFKETTLLFVGGVAYSVGAVIDWAGGPVVLRGVIGPHEVFHLLVIAGALCHWLFIYNWADGRSLAEAIPVPAVLSGVKDA